MLNVGLDALLKPAMHSIWISEYSPAMIHAASRVL